jgi:hypothetical protein
MIIDSADDLARRISDFGDASPKYDQLFEGYARLALQPGSAVLISRVVTFLVRSRRRRGRRS